MKAPPQTAPHLYFAMKMITNDRKRKMHDSYMRIPVSESLHANRKFEFLSTAMLEY